MLIDGKKIASQIQEELKEKIDQIQGRKPALAVILVGDHPSSRSYIAAKRKACALVGIESKLIELPSHISQSDLIKKIDALNRDPFIDGILVQLPLPVHMDETEIALAISPEKDIDGFHPINVGKMLLGKSGGFLPCTPLGIKVLLQKCKIPVERKHVVIVGRSNIVGKPLAAILMQKKQGCNATVTIAHSHTENLPQITRSADILIAAVGKPRFITKEMVKSGSSVIDVGINRTATKQLIGDVDFDEVSLVASHITPVPGGVGPMTIAMLLRNTLFAFLKMLILLLAFSCQKKDPCSHFDGTWAGKPYHIIIGDPISHKDLSHIIHGVFDTFSQTFDLQNPNSELSKLNHSSKDVLIPLSLTMQEVLELCDQIGRLSSYKFDPAIGPIAKAFKENQNLSDACEASGWQHISIQNGIFKKDCDSSSLVLGGVSKGKCVDMLIQKFREFGIENCVIEWAGNFRAIGHHPNREDWAVRVNPALTISNQTIAPIPLRNESLSVAGSHIIDPTTALPLEKTDFKIASATVIAPTCALANALSTAAMLFSSRKEAENWAQEIVDSYPDVSFWILSRDD